MRQIRTAPPKDEREYPLVITAEEKDKILTALLKKANGTEKAALKLSLIHISEPTRH